MKKNKEGHQCTRNMKHMQAQKDVRSVVIHNILRDSDVQLVNANAKIVTNMVISVACATRRKKHLTEQVFGVEITQSTPASDWFNLYSRFLMQPVRRFILKQRFFLLAIEIAIYTS